MLVTNVVFKNFCYLIVNDQTRELALVDPAWDKDLIERHIHELKARPSLVLITHHHRDHIHLARYFSRAYSIPIILSRAETKHYEIQIDGMRRVDDGEPLMLGREQITPYLTPGHTKGSICYHVDKNLFTGDTLFVRGCGLATPKTGGDPEELFRSLCLIKEQFSGDTRIQPGHPYGEVSGQTLAEVTKKNIYLQFNNIDKFREYRMRKRGKGLFKF